MCPSGIYAANVKVWFLWLSVYAHPTCTSVLSLQNALHYPHQVSAGCRCQCGAAKCQGYLEADSAQNRGALLMDTDSGPGDAGDDAGNSFMVSWTVTRHQPVLLACNNPRR